MVVAMVVVVVVVMPTTIGWLATTDGGDSSGLDIGERGSSGGGGQPTVAQ